MCIGLCMCVCVLCMCGHMYCDKWRMTHLVVLKGGTGLAGRMEWALIRKDGQDGHYI